MISREGGDGGPILSTSVAVGPANQAVQSISLWQCGRGLPVAPPPSAKAPKSNEIGIHGGVEWEGDGWEKQGL